MKKVIRLTESDLTRLVRRVIKEQDSESSNYGKEYLGDKALKYLTDTLKPFGFVHQPPRQWAPDMIYKTGLPEGEDINITFDEVWGSGPKGNTSKHQFELYIRTNNQKEIIKKYPFEKKDDYAGSPVLKQILNDLGQWKTYKPDQKQDYTVVDGKKYYSRGAVR